MKMARSVFRSFTENADRFRSVKKKKTKPNTSRSVSRWNQLKSQHFKGYNAGMAKTAMLSKTLRVVTGKSTLEKLRVVRPILMQSDLWIEKGNFRSETKSGTLTQSKKCLFDPNFSIEQPDPHIPSRKSSFSTGCADRTARSEKKWSLTRVTKSYLLALGTTQISSYFTKHWAKFLTHQT